MLAVVIAAEFDAGATPEISCVQIAPGGKWMCSRGVCGCGVCAKSACATNRPRNSVARIDEPPIEPALPYVFARRRPVQGFTVCRSPDQIGRHIVVGGRVRIA